MSINIIIQSYNEQNIERRNELDLCLLENLDNPYIKFIYDLTDKPKLNINSLKYKIIEHSKWITFQDAFIFANTIPNEYFAIINTDIILDKNSRWDIAIKTFLDNMYVLALSRHEYDINTKNSKLDPIFSQLFHAHTQDAWLFKTPINIQNCDFEIGLLGCDNAIADRINKSGYNIINKPIQFKIYHVDNVRGKTSFNFISKHTENTKILNKHPEELGCYLLPNYDIISTISIDDIIKMLNLNSTEKYNLICYIMSQKIKIKNR